MCGDEEATGIASPHFQPRREPCRRQADKSKRRFRKTPCLLCGKKRVAADSEESVGDPDQIKRRDRQDEARVGQKTKLTRRWAIRGTRPRALKDQRTKSAWIFGAICPARGVGAALVLPRCNTQAMQWHLDEISSQVTPGAHAVLFMDQAGWHTTGKLEVPSNITLMLLPPRSPELNPVENIWQFMRDNWLGNRIFKSYDEIVALCCEAWNKLIEQPWKIMSIGSRKWAMSSN